MPTGLRHYQQTRHLHFLTFSCYRQSPYLGTAMDRDLFESALERIRRRYEFVVRGYVVMPEHVHLLVSEPREQPLSSAIKALKLSVALRRRERPFWQARYYDFNVWSAEKETEKLKYIHRNPVTRGLVDHPEDWRWSSYRHYASGVAAEVEIGSQWTAFARGNRLPQAFRYREGAG